MQSQKEAACAGTRAAGEVAAAPFSRIVLQNEPVVNPPVALRATDYRLWARLRRAYLLAQAAEYEDARRGDN